MANTSDDTKFFKKFDQISVENAAVVNPDSWKVLIIILADS